MPQILYGILLERQKKEYRGLTINHIQPQKLYLYVGTRASKTQIAQVQIREAMDNPIQAAMGCVSIS